jgi:hypothetical protein
MFRFGRELQTISCDFPKGGFEPVHSVLSLVLRFMFDYVGLLKCE